MINIIERGINKVKDINAAGRLLNEFADGYDGAVYLQVDESQQRIEVQQIRWGAGTVEAQRSLSGPVEIFRASTVFISKTNK